MSKFTEFEDTSKLTLVDAVERITQNLKSKHHPKALQVLSFLDKRSEDLKKRLDKGDYLAEQISLCFSRLFIDPDDTKLDLLLVHVRDYYSKTRFQQ
jgi:hypothetical protein